ncbi:MAG: ankyrin repeat domain-containing protein [Woeseiaceae bacterium]|nr:ankyrin repeat domain-containing protein [Woeseiaceae bacterium]
MKNRLKFFTAAGICICFLLSGVNAAIGPVVDAASRGDTDRVRALLRDGADVNEAQGDGMTALHWAAETGNAELAEVLIFAGINVDAGTRIGHYTPLHIASRAGNAGIVKALLAAGADVEARTTNSGVTPLHLAAASGDAATVRLLIAAGADVDAREGAWQQTPLIFAASRNRLDTLEVLLEAGANPSISSAAIDTKVMETADKAAEKRITEFLAEFKEKEGGGPNWQPQPSQVQAAIEASREIQRKWPDVPDPECDNYEQGDGLPAGKSKCASHVTYNADGEPIYDYAADEDDDEPRPPTYGERVAAWGGLTPLLHAVRQGHRQAALLLLEYGADINQVSAGDHTSPLLMAAVNGQFDLALELIQRGADPNIASLAGATPLFAVIERQWASRASYAHPIEHQQQQANHLEVMQALLDAGADPNARLNTHLWYSEYTFSLLGGLAGMHYKGATPFWRASLALDVDAMRMLKEHGADPNIPTIKLPKRRRAQPPPAEAEVASADAKKTLTIEEQNLLAEEERLDEEVDHSGVPEVPVGGPHVYPIHAATGAGYGLWFAGNAHQYVPDNWLDAVKFLVEECGADVNIRDANAYTPLHHAASRGDTEVVQYLIDKGADVNVVSRKGQTTADMANGPVERVPPYPETIDLLVSHGAVNNGNCVSC